MLYELGTFSDVADTDEDIALRNYGNRLLKILSGDEINDNSIKEFANRIMRQPLPKSK